MDFIKASHVAIRGWFNPDNDYVIVAGKNEWHVGVIGIVASRVLKEFHRPTILFGGNGGEWRGSGRSIAGFDLAAALRECSPFLLRHGGHAFAAGLSVLPDQVDAFREKLNGLARAQLTADLLQPCLNVDAETTLKDLTPATVDQLFLLEPFGQSNPSVQILIRNLKIAGTPRPFGKSQQHVRAYVTDERSYVETLWWNTAFEQIPTQPFDLVCTAQVREYQGERTVQLRVLDTIVR